MYAVRTRFIPESIVHHFDNLAWPQAPGESTLIGKPHLEPVDVGARMRRMWG
jgi:DNA helicase-2/ATP-dependent DNA helicase PcrA